MARRLLAAVAIAAAAMAWGGSAGAADEAAGAAGPATGTEGDGAAGEGAEEQEPYRFLTGLDFSYWAADAGPNLWGPGLTVGFVLVPDHLELAGAIGAMLGGHQYTIPFELAFTVPFKVTPWFAPFLEVGTTIFTDKTLEETTNDVAFSAGAGIEFLPVGYDWGIYASGDYNLRALHGVLHQGGFTVGFHYRL